MPVYESSFRIGCGRYMQGKNLLSQSGAEIVRLGKHPLMIGDDTAITITKDVLEASIKTYVDRYEFIIHNGSCNDVRAQEIAAMKCELGYDVIVGVGGGVCMDFAKLCGYYARCPVMNIPTSSATCAAYTPLSVRYTPEWRTIDTLHYEQEVGAVLVDTAIIAGQPVRLLLSGVFDALAKFVEIKQRFREDTEEAYPLGLDYAYALSKQSYENLLREIDGCIEDTLRGEATERLERLIFTTIATTGVISGIARGSNQCALAHKFYEITRVLFPEVSKPYLHGELVGIGLILQNYFNGEEEKNVQLIELMKKHNMPYKISDAGIDDSDKTFQAYYERMRDSNAIDETDAEECEKLYEAMKYLWGM